MFISDFAIKRPLITVVSMLALVVFGVFSLLKLKTDEFPDVAPPYVSVGIVYPGASPDIVEYPDTGMFAAGAKTNSQRGKRFFVRLPLPEETE
jgi:Cu/Ag efflux pump CusA